MDYGLSALLVLSLASCKQDTPDTPDIPVDTTLCAQTSAYLMAETETGFYYTTGNILYYADRADLTQWAQYAVVRIAAIVGQTARHTCPTTADLSCGKGGSISATATPATILTKRLARFWPAWPTTVETERWPTPSPAPSPMQEARTGSASWGIS